jgi:His/Glu/Gln/Arg/opine family amino acid ABC transporter permease subunit
MEKLIAYAQEILQGLGTTLTLFIISLVIGFVLAAAVASFQIVFRGPVSRSVWMVMFAIRGVPLLLILYVVYYGFPLLPVVRETFLWSAFSSPFWCSIMCLVLVEIAFTSEIMRGAYYQTPKEQVDDAQRLSGLYDRSHHAVQVHGAGLHGHGDGHHGLCQRNPRPYAGYLRAAAHRRGDIYLPCHHLPDRPCETVLADRLVRS